MHDRYIAPLDDSNILPDGWIERSEGEAGRGEEGKWRQLSEDGAEKSSDNDSWALLNNSSKQHMITIRVLLDGLQNLVGIDKTLPEILSKLKKFRTLTDNRNEFVESRRKA